MAELAGRQAVIKIDTTSSGPGVVIDGVDNHTYKELCDMLDISKYGNEYKNRIGGLKDTNVTLSGNYNPSDTNGQLKIVPGDFVWLQVLPDGTNGKKVKMIVEDFTLQAPVEGKQTFSSTLQGVEAPSSVSA